MTTIKFDKATGKHVGTFDDPTPWVADDADAPEKVAADLDMYRQRRNAREASMEAANRAYTRPVRKVARHDYGTVHIARAVAAHLTAAHVEYFIDGSVIGIFER